MARSQRLSAKVVFDRSARGTISSPRRQVVAGVLITAAANAEWNDGPVGPLDGAAGRQFDRVRRNACDAGWRGFNRPFENAYLRNSEIVYDHAKLRAKIDHFSVG